jgi:LysR family hydrogen peroxide-inducible transcriptional activator
MALRDPVPYSLRQLQYVVAVAELGGFRRAAEACGVAQPSLSAQVAHVESALGVQIFERGARGVRVSAAGAPVVERARAVLLAARDFSDAARQQADPLRGTLRIGIIPTVCPYLLPELARPLRRKLPDLHVVWSEDKTAPLLEQISEARLDAAIVARDARVARFEQAPIGDDPFVLAAAPEHPLMRRSSPASPDALGGATVYLLDDGHCFRDQALALCGASGAQAADLSATGLSTLVQMVAAGDGVTLLPRMAVAVENRRGQLAVRPFRSPPPMRRLVLAWRKGSALGRPLNAVADVARQAWPGVAKPHRSAQATGRASG